MEERDPETGCPVTNSPIKIDVRKHCANHYCDAVTLDVSCRALRVLARKLRIFRHDEGASPSRDFDKETGSSVRRCCGETEERGGSTKPLTLYKCRVCGLGSLRHAELTNHRALHVVDDPFSCGLCGKGYVSENAVKLHVVCLHLSDRHATQSEFSEDMERALRSEGLDINAYVARNGEAATAESNDMFEQDETLMSIRRFSVAKNQRGRRSKRRIATERRSSCSATMVLFSPGRSRDASGKYIVASRVDLRAILATVESDFSCPVCCAKCRSRKNLHRHIRGQHMKWRCNVCGMAFGKRAAFASHMATHKHAWFYQCCICGARYCSGRSLTSHLGQHATRRLGTVSSAVKPGVEEARNGSADDDDASCPSDEIKEEPILFHLSDSDDSFSEMNR